LLKCVWAVVVKPPRPDDRWRVVRQYDGADGRSRVDLWPPTEGAAEKPLTLTWRHKLIIRILLRATPEWVPGKIVVIEDFRRLVKDNWGDEIRHWNENARQDKFSKGILSPDRRIFEPFPMPPGRDTVRRALQAAGMID
jgi:hypothetical protein